jgi:PhnB protein
MFVAEVRRAVEFLATVFDAEAAQVEEGRPTDVRIGDSLVLLSSADDREPFPAFLYVYVDDADAVYLKALKAGASSVEAPLDTPYGDRRAMFQDPFGNMYQVAHRLQAEL